MNDEQLLLKRLSQISTWGKFGGIVTMIFGGFSALFGLLFFGIGALPGILSVVLGYFQFKVGQNATILKNNANESAQLALFDYLGKQYLFLGIMLVISIISFIFFIILTIAGFVMFDNIINVNDYHFEIKTSN
ncbi:DUF5362 family protein [Fervidibacillus albus]|uniref:DUF5362 family protein n=1 Tax=Fervidibacillus albus TaxID=2980026 RepID=A0A9E8LTQ3_9BACI|nr:DUF5362 family protein [Fervidibacillus albus]WAA09352.1 DUF5362 family protein [Fervidibacillus albus]